MKSTIAALLMNSVWGTPNACLAPQGPFLDDGRGQLILMSADGLQGIEWSCEWTGVTGATISATCWAEGEEQKTAFAVVPQEKSLAVSQTNGETFTLQRCD